MAKTIQVETAEVESKFDGSHFDIYGNALRAGVEVLFAIGSKIKTGLCIAPVIIYIPVGETDDEAGDDDDDDGTTDENDDGAPVAATTHNNETKGQDTTITPPILQSMPGVLIYNERATNRKMVRRQCTDVSVVR
jgi:hypothetical protein